jgi:cytochrome c5
MKRCKIPGIAILLSAIVFSSCSEGAKKEPKPIDIQELTKDTPGEHAPEIKGDEVKLTNPLNVQWVAAGKATYELKCQPCHKLTADKLVGPGWLDVTKRRTPVWIINMVTNTDMMLDSDAEARKLLELCMVRMPNQNLTKDQAREVIEFMRSNDGEK